MSDEKEAPASKPDASTITEEDTPDLRIREIDRNPVDQEAMVKAAIDAGGPRCAGLFMIVLSADDDNNLILGTSMFHTPAVSGPMVIASIEQATQAFLARAIARIKTAEKADPEPS